MSMVTPALQTLIGAAEACESLMVPALFSAWAPIVADAAGLRAGDRVLDVACGTGVLAREAAARIGTAGRVAASDPGVGMLAVAKRLAPAIDWREGAAESLPFPDASFDAVVSQFGLMFFTDRPAGIREMLRVLKPDGRISVAVWDSIEADPAYAAVVDVLDRRAVPRQRRPIGERQHAPRAGVLPVGASDGRSRFARLAAAARDRPERGSDRAHPGRGGTCPRTIRRA